MQFLVRSWEPITFFSKPLISTHKKIFHYWPFESNQRSENFHSHSAVSSFEKFQYLREIETVLENICNCFFGAQMKLAKGRVDMYRYKDFSFDGSAEPSLALPFENIIKVVNYHCLPVLNLNQHFSLNFSM